MSTQHTDLSKDQETPPRDSQSLNTADTAQQVKVSPSESFPQPPRGPSHTKRARWIVVAAVIVALALILSFGVILIPQLGQHPATQVTPTPTALVTTVTPPRSDLTPSPSQGVVPGPQNGPPGVNTTAYWDNVLGTQGTNGKVERVSFANIIGNPTLQALVTVRHSDANSTLDVYVFDKITNARPTQIFMLSGLIKGDAKISYYNSVMTAEVDTNSTLNAGKSVSQMTPDLFREFAWSNGTMSQVAFPGIFPDLTRYQAEADQARVNQGYDPWKNDPTMVAKFLASQFFGWQRTMTTELLSGGGSQDVYATVQVQEPPMQGAQSQGPSAVVTLSRLEGNTHNMWVAIAVNDGTMLTLTNIPARSLITSPVTLKGTGAAFEAVIGHAAVYDHLYDEIGHAQVLGDNGMGIVNYSTKVSYTSTFKGVQEGVVAVYEANGGISSENFTVVMVKVLISG